MLRTDPSALRVKVRRDRGRELLAAWVNVDGPALLRTLRHSDALDRIQVGPIGGNGPPVWVP